MTLKGGQLGNTNASKGKPWRDALDKALKQYVNKDAGLVRGQALFSIATRVVEQALSGNKDAIQEIGNRMDGRPHQSMDIGIHDSMFPEEMTEGELLADINAARTELGDIGKSVRRTAKAPKKPKQPSELH